MAYFRTASPDRYSLLKEYARENRNNMTEAEKVLWNCLKRKGINGHKFFRQHILQQIDDCLTE